jgi:peptidoglycan-associated lipoprotein
LALSNPEKEPKMTSPFAILRLSAAAATVALAAACGGGPPPHAQSANNPPPVANYRDTTPELAGAWYEVFFDSNSTAIDQRGRSIVNNVAYVVKNEPTTRVTIIGKTDRTGTQAANMALSQNRANVVRTALIAAGVPPNRIDASWTGELGQDTAIASDVADRRNRVVDITVVKAPR